ncbi:MAG: PepSY-associated TM helix domain-containing protein [Leptonema sp. (in: Bacteria)]|nr:PepSY-associated TM helix domain-containing protein [Leptonema sp. (in: bacteria)]
MKKSWRVLNLTLHRDLGYFFATLTIMYCLSGLALNHIDDWNPDFIIYKKDIQVPARLESQWQLEKADVVNLNQMVDEPKERSIDYPTKDQVKIYYQDGSLHLNMATGVGNYEKLKRRPIFYESNLLHKNGVPIWNWVSDIFAIALIIINITGLLVLRGRYGLVGRGKWYLATGAILPAVALMYHFVAT